MSEPLVDVIVRSIYISTVAAFIAFMFGALISIAMLMTPRRLSEVLLSVFDTLVGIPTIVIGLALYMFIYPGGPLGFLNLLYTPTALMISQFLVALPITVTLFYRYFEHLWSDIRELVLSLGAPVDRVYPLLLRESPPALIAVYLVAFSRAIGALGAVLVVGGGVEGLTNVLTTAIALEVLLGNYEYALTLGGVLVALTVIPSIVARTLGGLVWR
jgi:ABC-type tungstate transport system, periplasmic component